MYCMLAKIAQTLKHDAREWIEWVVAGWPETFFGTRMRLYYWSKKFNLKTKPVIGRGSKLYGPTIVIGNHFTCGENVEISATKSKGIYIGNDVLMARGVYIRGANHRFEDINIPIWKQGHYAASINHAGNEYSIIIEDDVWIAANVMILSGARIGKGSVVAAGAVVINANYPPNSIIAGVPAKVIKSRFPVTNGQEIEYNTNN